MSLKVVHIFFISACVFLSVSLGFWALRFFLVSKSLINLSATVGAFACGFLLIGYLFWFLKEMQRINRS